ncbi:hypothetical protein Strvi_5333 [Streptomyces violaceusniger Tu 4113]|uniref:Uncharacterized protein n=1 Tax=Streptomyces violaceusniger (strain Tu 4113) TaxID=653045 RepID=G2PFT2_STRV4|nr:hypothetical protein Strvi_5333 [Streptomyces violaceusniger Tu 4113]
MAASAVTPQVSGRSPPGTGPPHDAPDVVALVRAVAGHWDPDAFPSVSPGGRPMTMRTPRCTPRPLAPAPPPPGLGPRTWAGVPRRCGQLLVVTGRDRNAPVATAVLYERAGAGRRAGASRPAHNALNGWTDHHREAICAPPSAYTPSRTPADSSPTPEHGCPTTGRPASPRAARAAKANPCPARSTTWPPSTTTAGPAPPWTGPAPSARTGAAASGCTSTTADPRAGASASGRAP